MTTTNWIFSGLCGDFDHDVGAEEHGGKEDPEDVIEQEADEEDGADLERGQSDVGYEGDTQPHGEQVHQQPVASHQPQHQQGQRDHKRQDLAGEVTTQHPHRHSGENANTHSTNFIFDFKLGSTFAILNNYTPVISSYSAQLLTVPAYIIFDSSRTKKYNYSVSIRI